MHSSTATHGTKDRQSGAIRATETSVIAAVVVTLLLGLPCRGQAVVCSTPTFNVQDFAVGGNPVSLAVDDFNGDGKKDVAVLNLGSEDVSLLLGNGGGFAAAPTSPFSVGAGTAPFFLAAGNFDGNEGLAAAELATGGVSVLLGNGSGAFGAPTHYPVGDNSAVVVTADLNNDSKADLVVLDYVSGVGEVSVLLGNGNGTFNPATHVSAGPSPAGIAVGLFNNDAFQDLAVANFATGDVYILLGNGSGGFGAPNSFAAGTDAFFVATGDFNQDGKQDLVVLNSSGGGSPTVPNSISVLLGDGSGGFGAPASFAVGGTNAFSFVVKDFNGDNKADVAVANRDSNTVSVLLGNGSGGFGAATDFAVGASPGFVAAADFNGDGKQDLVVTDYDSNTVSVLLNSCGSTHDVVVLPVKPLTVTIPASGTPVNKKLSVRVRNADLTHTTGFPVKLVVDDSDCGAPGSVAQQPDFMLTTPGLQGTVPIADGKTRTAKAALTFNSAAFTSFNHNAPHRCTLWVTASVETGDINTDPTPSNNSFPVEINVINRHNLDNVGPESTITSLNPVTLTIASGKPSKTLTAKPKVGNADVNPMTISATAVDGTCPPGLVGVVDLSTAPGVQSSFTVAKASKKTGTLPLLATSAVCTPNKLAPRRCIAMVSATGAAGDTDATNNVTRLVIDVVDRNDLPGSCVP